MKRTKTLQKPSPAPVGKKLPTVARPLGDVKALAATFEGRRFAAEMNLTSRLSREDVHIYYQVKQDEAAYMGEYLEDRHIFGNADAMNDMLQHGHITAMKFRYWRRRELWNRLRWLRGELTRLMTGQPHKPRKHPKAYPIRNMTREELIEWRRSQIPRYMMALEKYAPMHAEIANHKRNAKKRKARAQAKKTKRAKEFADALGRPFTEAIEEREFVTVPENDELAK